MADNGSLLGKLLTWFLVGLAAILAIRLAWWLVGAAISLTLFLLVAVVPVILLGWLVLKAIGFFRKDPAF